MNDCLGCAGVPPDDGFISFIMRLIDNPLSAYMASKPKRAAFPIKYIY